MLFGCEADWLVVAALPGPYLVDAGDGECLVCADAFVGGDAYGHGVVDFDGDGAEVFAVGDRGEAIEGQVATKAGGGVLMGTCKGETELWVYQALIVHGEQDGIVWKSGVEVGRVLFGITSTSSNEELHGTSQSNRSNTAISVATHTAISMVTYKGVSLVTHDGYDIMLNEHP